MRQDMDGKLMSSIPAEPFPDAQSLEKIDTAPSPVQGHQGKQKQERSTGLQLVEYHAEDLEVLITAN